MFRPFSLAISSLVLAGTAQAAAPINAVSVASTGAFNNAVSLLTDGNVSLFGVWTDPVNVWWQGQEGAAGVTFTFDLGAVFTLTDLSIGMDNNDFYALQVSTNGTTWNALPTALASWVDTAYIGGVSMIQKSSDSTSAAYAPLMDFQANQARYVRVFAQAGDGYYALSEVSFSGTPLAPVPEPETYALMAAGLLAVGFAARRRRG